MKNKGKKVVVAMSGGVDSSVAAAILKNQGYEVVGVFMQFWFPVGEVYGENRCCSLESFNEAKAVADILKIPIHKLNFGVPFKKIIVDEFLREYRRGQTPNPCVACNKFIKFDLLLKKAKVIFGVDYLATGHYARVEKCPPCLRGGDRKSVGGVGDSSSKLLRGKDEQKDQSYFLYNLKQSQLKHLLFPLGDFKKSEVRKMAKKFGLPVHDKKDSQEICFVGQSHYEFLKKYLKLKPGKIITSDTLPLRPFGSPPLIKGRQDFSKFFPLHKERSHINPPPLYKGVAKQRAGATPSAAKGRVDECDPGSIQRCPGTVGEGYVLGTHHGLPLYTLGQRSGIGLAGGPWYVCGFDYKKNQLIVTKKQKNSAIFQKQLICDKINWLGQRPKLPLKCQAQIRYHSRLADCEILSPCPRGTPRRNIGAGGGRYLIVKFQKPQRAIMPGQSVVFYDKDELLGGGIIK